MSDLRYAVRMLVKSPGLSLATSHVLGSTTAQRNPVNLPLSHLSLDDHPANRLNGRMPSDTHTPC